MASFGIRVLCAAALSAAAFVGVVEAVDPPTSTATAAPTASTTSTAPVEPPAQTATTSTAPPPSLAGSANNAQADGWLKPTSLVIGIIGVIIGGIIGGLIGVLVSVWKGVRWAVFTTLQSGSGPDDLMKLVYAQIDSSSVRDKIAAAVLAHLQQEPGRTTFQKYILNVLGSPDADEPMRKLITRLIVLREESKEKVEQQVEDLRNKILEQKLLKRATLEVQLTHEQLEQSTVAKAAADPVANQEEILALVRKLAAHFDSRDQETRSNTDPAAEGRAAGKEHA